MSNAFFKVPAPVNEPILSYAPGSPEKAALKSWLTRMQAEEIEVPLFIGGEEIKTGDVAEMRAPHDHSIKLGVYHKAGEKEVKLAIEAALDARSAWAAMPWEHRVSVFLKAADLLAGPWRPIINGATILGQSKTVYQAEIDAACEICDFYRFNSYYMAEIMAGQPISDKGIWNRVEYRAAGRFHLCGLSLQFHLDWRQPAHRPGYGRQCGAVETGVQFGFLELVCHANAAGCGPA